MGNEPVRMVDHYVDDFREPILNRDPNKKSYPTPELYTDNVSHEEEEEPKDQEEVESKSKSQNTNTKDMEEKDDKVFCGYCTHCFDAHKNQPNPMLYFKVCGGECNQCKKKHIVYYQWDKEQGKANIVQPPYFVNTFIVEEALNKKV